MVTPAEVRPRLPAAPASGDSKLAAARAKIERKLIRLAPGSPTGSIDLFSVAFGMVQTSSAGRQGSTFSTALVRADDWTTIGHLVSVHSAQGALRWGALRAELVDGSVFEAFTPEGDRQVLGLSANGEVLGCWRATDMTYSGRFAQPLRRELWSRSRRVGWVDSSLLSSGCAVLELVPNGQVLVPIRVRAAGIIDGNPWKEVLKATRFGRHLGPRSPNLDTVLAPHAVWMEADLDLFFVASLALRTVSLARLPSSD